MKCIMSTMTIIIIMVICISHVICFWPLCNGETVDADFLALDLTQVGAQGKFSSLCVSSFRLLCITHSALKEADAAFNLLTE